MRKEIVFYIAMATSIDGKRFSIKWPGRTRRFWTYKKAEEFIALDDDPEIKSYKIVPIYKQDKYPAQIER